MTSTYSHGTEMQRRLVALLRADTTLSDTGTGLLFPAYAPQVNSDDVRVYESDVQFPPGDALSMTLPRVLIEVVARAHDFEQETGILTGPVRVWVHTVTAKEDSAQAERIDAYIATVLLSTSLSDTRIIAANLSVDGDRRRGRIPAFDGAFEIVSGYSTPNVGSLQ